MNITLIAAPHSGAGKTTLTLGLLRAFARKGRSVRPAKSGPDYIDPAFHSVAAGQTSVNLDAWAMPEAQIYTLAQGTDDLLIEGAMGLFDGAGLAGKGSAADLARSLNARIVLIVDCARMSHSVAALVNGFTTLDETVPISGLILNQVGSDKHERVLRRALADANAPEIIGVVRRQSHLSLPSRHLGLVQAAEHPDLDGWLDQLAEVVTKSIDLDKIFDGSGSAKTTTYQPPQPPAQRIAVAQDVAFAFAYPHLLQSWRAAGAEIQLFSPLNDDPIPDADFVYLPGGYPELHAGKIASNTTFLSSLNDTSQATDIYGECGGYMVLGDTLIDANGTAHRMAGLLPVETSFAARKLHLGYRQLHGHAGPFQGAWRGHEFHYASTLRNEGPALFTAMDVDENPLPDMGCHIGRVSGSFAHIISKAP